MNGGVPLASSRFSSSRPDAVDVRYAVQAFQHINQVRIEIRMSLMELEGEPVFALEMVAHDLKKEVGDQPSLASVKSKIGYRERHQMEAVILQGLYKLDGELAEREFAKTDS